MTDKPSKPRRVKTQIDANGDAWIKACIKRPLWLLATERARQLDLPPEVGLAMLLERCVTLALSGQLAWAGEEWIMAYKAIHAEHFGALQSGPPIDFNVLHKSTKTKSGFTGVYANGKGFRAMVTKGEGQGEKYLGTFETAEEAAHHRYLYYKENKLPYGEMEVDMARWRADGFRGTDAELQEQILKQAEFLGYRHVFEPDRYSPEKLGQLGFDKPLPPEVQAKMDKMKEQIAAERAAREAYNAKMLAVTQPKHFGQGVTPMPKSDDDE